ncbi:MAG TPA: hypothetical protein VIV60_05865, partial [Polyangiaceae bacterium]
TRNTAFFEVAWMQFTGAGFDAYDWLVLPASPNNFATGTSLAARFRLVAGNEQGASLVTRLVQAGKVFELLCRCWEAGASRFVGRLASATHFFPGLAGLIAAHDAPNFGMRCLRIR